LTQSEGLELWLKIMPLSLQHMSRKPCELLETINNVYNVIKHCHLWPYDEALY
jgi:hypothetical protein